MENQTIKMKVLREKYSKDMLNNLFFKDKKSEKDFIELNDLELKDWETKIKRQMGNYFLNQII